MSPADDLSVRPVLLPPALGAVHAGRARKRGEHMSESGTDADCPRHADGMSQGGIEYRASDSVDTETSAVRHPRP